MTTGSREDYLINILRLSEGDGIVKTSELANFMNVAPASVTEIIKSLSDEGLVDYRRYKGVSLTEEGLKCARSLRRKHHIMERFLTDVLDIDHADAHDEACRMEHSMSEESANRLCRLIGTSKDCDCGTCSEPCGVKPEDSLDLLAPGDAGVISHLRSEDPSKVKKLISMGFVPGRDVRMENRISSDGPRIVTLGNATIALDSELVSAVFVCRG